LIADTLAVRGVIYNDRRGGYISNVPATFTRKSTDLASAMRNIPPVAAAPARRARFRRELRRSTIPPSQESINPVTYQGLRLSGLWNINDNWNALLMQSYQNMDAEACLPNAEQLGRRSAARQSVTLFTFLRQGQI